MATNLDSFLADLEELSDVRDDDNGDLSAINEAVNYDNDLDRVSKLQKTKRFNDNMQKVEDALKGGSEIFSNQLGLIHVLEDDDKLFEDCNALCVEIDNEIGEIHNFIRGKYRLKFPELESLVHDPIDYARLVKKIGNQIDLTLVDLEGLLPKSIALAVSVTASYTSLNSLSDESLQKTIDACDRALSLDSSKKRVLDFLESRMGIFAPNLLAIVGSSVAAKLIGTVGGLSALANMPACDIQLLGAKRKALAGFSTATSLSHLGYLEETDIFQSTQLCLRRFACKRLAEKSRLAVGIDSARGYPTGSYGISLRAEIDKEIEKLQKLCPGYGRSFFRAESGREIEKQQKRRLKPLPVPHSEPGKKRGSRRHRKMKKINAMEEIRKLANWISFGGFLDESSVGDNQSNLAAKAARRFKQKNYYAGKSSGNGATSGLTSSLAFTPDQGIILGNPQAHSDQLGSGTQSTYFSETGTFSRINRT